MKKMKKAISVFTALTVTLWLSGLFMILPIHAAFADGDLARETDEFDVYIIKLVGAEKFKRLILNPDVFNMYGHLEWGDVQVVADGALADYTTSELVREINDDKVYKLYPDGDVGTKKWVETLDCFNSQGFDWDSVYIINSFDRDSYTTASEALCGGAVVTGDMTLSVAADSPEADTIPPNVQGVSYLKVDVAGSGTVNQVTVKRSGAGAVGDFGDLYIYQNGVRLTSGRSLSAATSKATFINLGLEAPTSFSVVADMAAPSTTAANSGNVNYFVIESADDITTDATVGGTFPLAGAKLAISATSAGTLAVIPAGSGSRNATIGDTDVEISQFKVTTATEGTYLRRIQLFNGGTVSNTLITNLELKDNTAALVATADEIGSDGYVALVFDDPYYIKKGDSEIFRLYATIGGVKTGRTIKLYLELSTDILGTGNIYGYGMAATITSFDAVGTSSSKAIDITCKGGDLTLNKVGPNAANISTNVDDLVFLEYTMTAAADITIKRTELIFCHDDAGGGYSEASVSAGADITDIKIVDKDTGTVIVGPKDGTAFDDDGATGGIAADNTAGKDACPAGADGMWESFTDTFDLSSGETNTYQVTADIDITATDSGIELKAGDAIKFILYSYATMVTDDGTVNYMKYTGTTDAVPDEVIAPSGNLAGEEMTLAAASLAITLAASPSGGDNTDDEKVYIKGQTGVNAVGLIFTAGAASDITINNITLVSEILEATKGTWADGIDTNYVKDSIGNVYIYDKTTGELIPGSTAKGFTSGTYSEHVDFTGLNWVIPAGEDRTLLVKCDISSAAPSSLSTADTWIAFDIENTADVSAVDSDGNSVDASGNDANSGSGTPTVNFGIADHGSVTIAAASDTPDKSILLMGTSDNEVSKFKLTGTNEGWYFSKFSIVLYDATTDETGSGDPNNRDNIDGAKLKYQTEAQWGTSDWTISSEKTFGATATLAFNFSGDARPYVPKDDDSYISVLLDIVGYEGGYGAKSKQPVRIQFTGYDSDDFKAYGAQSGYYESSLDEPTYTDFKLHYVARSYPVFAKKAWSGGELEMARFTITAEGYDVVFTGTEGNSQGNLFEIASAALRFGVVASSTDGAAIDLILYDWNENIVASVDEWYADAGVSSVVDGFSGEAASVTFSFEVNDVTIPNGTTKEFHVDLGGADIAEFNKTDEYIYLELKNDATAFGNLATGDMDYGEHFVVWHDGTNEEGIGGDGDPELRYGMPEDVLGIGLPITFRTLRGTGTP